MKVPPLELNETLSEPMARLFSLYPNSEPASLLQHTRGSEYSTAELIEIRTITQQDDSYRSDLNYIAQPIAQKLTALKPPRKKHFNKYLSWKSHLAIGLAVFFVSTALHLGVT